MAMPPKFVGTPVKRREDPWLITGTATYVDDLHLAGMTYMAVLRSPFGAHACIVEVDGETGEIAIQPLSKPSPAKPSMKPPSERRPSMPATASIRLPTCTPRESIVPRWHRSIPNVCSCVL